MLTAPELSDLQRFSIANQLETAANALAPDVIQITHEFGESWVGDPIININILLSDAAAKFHHKGEKVQPLMQTFDKVKDALIDFSMEMWRLGFEPITNFRSASENRRSKQKWALQEAACSSK